VLRSLLNRTAGRHPSIYYRGAPLPKHRIQRFVVADLRTIMASFEMESQMNRMDKRPRSAAAAFLTLFVLAIAAAALSSCNTTAGVGQDVSATGRAVTNSAEKVKSGL
jgi:entericidin B